MRSSSSEEGSASVVDILWFGMSVKGWMWMTFAVVYSEIDLVWWFYGEGQVCLEGMKLDFWVGKRGSTC